MIHQALNLSIRNYRSSVTYLDNKKREFDKNFLGGEVDRAFYLSQFDINLVSWEGNEHEWDLYYDGAEDNYGEEIFTITKIGEIYGHYFNIERMQLSGYDLFDTFDMHDEDEYSLAKALFDRKDNDFNMEVTNKIAFWAPKAFFYITKFCINKEYQNQGYGTKIMQDIEKMLYFGMDYNISFVALHCNPLDDDKHNNKEAMKKLANFYKKCGFEHIGNKICMIKIIDEFINED